MALAATFTANFEAFDRELAKAEASLKGFEVPVGNVKRALQSMVLDFSGQRVVQDAEKMAAAVAAVGGPAALTAQEMARVNATVSEAIEKYQRLGKDVPDDLRRLAAETKQAEERTSAWSLGVGTLASALGNMAANAVQALASMAWDTITGGVIGMNSQLETARLQFETLTGSTERADEIVRSLFEFAKSTPFETTQVIEAARKMEVFGGSALNTEENLRLVGDAAAATGAPIEDVSFWVGRMYAAMAANKPIGEAIQNLQQLGVVGPDAVMALQDVAASGKGVEEKFRVMQDALGRFSGAMEKQAGTWSGLMSTFSDTVQMTLAQMGKPLFDVLKEMLDAFNTWAASPEVQGFIDVFATTIAEAVAWLVDRGSALAGTIGEWVDWFAEAAGAVGPLNEGFTWLRDLALEVMAQIGADVWETFVAVLEAVWAAAKALWDVLRPVYEFLQPIAALIAAAAWVIFGQVVHVIAEALQLAAKALEVFFSGISAVVGKLGAAKDAVVGFVGAAASVLGFGDELPKVTRATIDMGAAFTVVDTEAGKVAGISMADLEGGTKRTGAASGEAAKEAKKHADELRKLTGADVIADGIKLAKSIEEAGVQSVIAAGHAEQHAKKLNEAITIMDRQGKDVPAGMRELALTLDMVSNKTGSVAAAALMMGTRTVEASASAEVLAGAYNLASEDISRSFGMLPEAARTAGVDVTGILQKQADEAREKTKAKWAEFGRGISSTILDAVTGGGNVGEAIGAFVGSGIGSKLNEWAQQGLSGVTGALGGLLSGAANAVLPGFGALIGGGLSKLFDSVFKGEEKKVNDLRDGFIANAGGLAALNEEAHKAGVTLDRLLDAKKTKDFEAAQKELTKAIEAHKAALADLDADLTETFTKGATLTDDLAARMLKLFQQDPEGAGGSIFKFLQGEIANVTNGFNTAAAAWSETLTGGEAGFRRFGVAAVAAFEAAKESGASVPEALAAIKPGLEALVTAAGELGTGGSGNAAFDQLLAIANLSTQFGPLLEQVSGLGTMITSLGNVGLLTQDTFTALADQIGATFEAMTAQGANAEDAVRLLQPQLQKLWEAQQQFGVETTGATAALLDQAVQAGVVGDQFRSAQDRMIESVNRLVTRLGDLVTVMTGGTPTSVTGGAQWAAGQVTTSLQSINVSGPTSTVQGLGTTMREHLPWSAAVGKDGVNAQLGGVSIARPAGEIVALGATMRDYLPWSGQVGIGGVNRAFDEIDVESVQDAVHDISWEFDRGIPDAADSGVDLVNASMDVAEGAIGTVDVAASAVADTLAEEIPAASGVAGGAIWDFAQDAVDYLGSIEDAATAAAWGHSPTGIKEIPVALDEAGRALRSFERLGVGTFGAVEARAARLTVPALEGGVSGRGRGGAAAGLRQEINVWLDRRLLAEAVAEELPGVVDAVVGVN